MPPYVFLDASALVKRYVEETGTETVTAILNHPDLRGRLFVARHVEGELISALNKRYRSALLGAKAIDEILAHFKGQFPDIFAVVPLKETVIWDGHGILNRHRDANIAAGDAYQLAAMRTTFHKQRINSGIRGRFGATACPTSRGVSLQWYARKPKSRAPRRSARRVPGR